MSLVRYTAVVSSVKAGGFCSGTALGVVSVSCVWFGFDVGGGFFPGVVSSSR